MVQVTKPESNVEDGVYTLRIGKSSVKKIRNSDTNKEEDRIEFTFTCLDGASEGESFTDLTSFVVSKKGKLGKIYRAAMGTEEVPDDWDTDDLKGKKFQALVITNDSGYPRINADSVKPAKAGSTRSRPQPVKSDDDDDDTWDDEENAA